MSNYICKRCGYSIDKKSNYIRHLNRKKSCQELLSNISIKDLLQEIIDRDNSGNSKNCKYCNKNFTSRQGKYQHQKICKENKGVQDKNSENIDLNLKLLEKINKLEEKNNKLEEKIKNMENQKPIIQNNYNTYNNKNSYKYNDNKNITNNLNNFGEENLKHISFDDLTRYSSGLNDGFTKFIEDVHFNKDIEENMNIRMKTKDIIEVVNDGKWVEKSCSNTIDRIIGVGRKILFRHFIENKETEERLDELSEVLQEYYLGLMNSSQDYHKLKKDLYFVIKHNTIYVMQNTDE